METQRSVALIRGVSGGATLRRTWPQLALALVAILAGVLDFWNLSVNGLGNGYYAEAVRSMTRSWEAFRYAAFDLNGTWTTVDKPPLAFWIQAASAKLFGYSSWSLLGPSALAGALSVAVLGRTVTRLFGVWAGLIAALALALTPVALIASRSNNTDGILALMVVLGTWAGVRAMESGRWRWVVLTGVFFGLGFLTKMLAAFLILPGIVAAYLIVRQGRLRLRLLQLAAAAAIVAAISFGWMLSVDLTPAADRPHVSGSPNNTEIGLALGWNGLDRVFGGAPGAPRGGSGAPSHNEAVTTGPGPDAEAGPISGSSPKSNSNPRPASGAASEAFGGPSGFTRLLTGALGAQGSWLLPLAVVGLISAVVAAWGQRRSPRMAGLIVFGTWVGVVWAIFSFSRGVFHPYYISELAPGVAALGGVGTVTLWRDALAGGWRLALPATAALSTAVFEWYLLRSEQTMTTWGWVLIVISGLLALAILARALLGRRVRGSAGRSLVVVTAAVSIGLAALLVAPAAFDWQLITTPTTGAIPMAEPPGSAPGPTGQFQTGPPLNGEKPVGGLHG